MLRPGEQPEAIEDIEGDGRDLDVRGLQGRVELAGEARQHSREADRLRVELRLEVIDIELEANIATEHVLLEEIPRLGAEDDGRLDRLLEGEVARAPVDERRAVDLQLRAKVLVFRECTA